jgi:predicted transcriptional regulator
MTTLSIRVPDSLHRAIKELAMKDGYSMNQFLITAAAEKLSALETVDYLRHRAERANLKDFDNLLARVPNGDPDPGDELSPKQRKRSGIRGNR